MASTFGGILYYSAHLLDKEHDRLHKLNALYHDKEARVAVTPDQKVKVIKHAQA